MAPSLVYFRQLLTAEGHVELPRIESNFTLPLGISRHTPSGFQMQVAGGGRGALELFPRATSRIAGQAFLPNQNHLGSCSKLQGMTICKTGCRALVVRQCPEQRSRVKGRYSQWSLYCGRWIDWTLSIKGHKLSYISQYSLEPHIRLWSVSLEVACWLLALFSSLWHLLSFFKVTPNLGPNSRHDASLTTRYTTPRT